MHNTEDSILCYVILGLGRNCVVFKYWFHLVKHDKYTFIINYVFACINMVFKDYFWETDLTTSFKLLLKTKLLMYIVRDAEFWKPCELYIATFNIQWNTSYSAIIAKLVCLLCLLACRSTVYSCVAMYIEVIMLRMVVQVWACTYNYSHMNRLLHKEILHHKSLGCV